MSRWINSLKSAVRKTLSFLVRFAPVRVALLAWYKLSLKCLALIAKGESTSQIRGIYTRHQNWILGISDIDLIISFDDDDPTRYRALFVSFWRRYMVLRLFFPMLCELSEIRWISPARSGKHPFLFQPEAQLLTSSEQWGCVYSRAGEATETPLVAPGGADCRPFTRFLEFNLYGYIQRQLFSNEPQPELRIDRMAKCAVKILQHLHFLQTGQYVDVQQFQENMLNEGAGLPWRHYKEMMRGLISTEVDQENREREIARSIYTILLDLSRAHQGIMEGEPPGSEPRHAIPGEWWGTGLSRFLEDVKQRFSDEITLVAYKSPYRRHHTRLFVVISPDMSFEDFYSFVTFARKYHEVFLAEKVLLNATTPDLLTSQFYSLWGNVALEGHALQVQEVYAPHGGLKILPPKEEWTLKKIRESVAVFEELYLPLMMSPLGKGGGMDFCKIYERTETEILFHYYCYLKNRDSYLELIRDSGGSTDEVIAYSCSRYGNEIGIQNWHPIRVIDAYPYLKKLIRQVDEMALARLESGTSETQYSI